MPTSCFRGMSLILACWHPCRRGGRRFGSSRLPDSRSNGLGQTALRPQPRALSLAARTVLVCDSQRSSLALARGPYAIYLVAGGKPESVWWKCTGGGDWARNAEAGGVDAQTHSEPPGARRGGLRPVSRVGLDTHCGAQHRASVLRTGDRPSLRRCDRSTLAAGEWRRGSPGAQSLALKQGSDVLLGRARRRACPTR